MRTLGSASIVCDDEFELTAKNTSIRIDLCHRKLGRLNNGRGNDAVGAAQPYRYADLYGVFLRGKTTAETGHDGDRDGARPKVEVLPDHKRDLPGSLVTPRDPFDHLCRSKKAKHGDRSICSCDR